MAFHTLHTTPLMRTFLPALAAGILLHGCSRAVMVPKSLLNSQRSLDAISVTPQVHVVPIGVTTQFTATGIYSDGTSEDISGNVQWTTSQPTVAQPTVVSNLPLVRGLSAGTAVISAALSGVSGQSPVTVTNAVLSSLEISPLTPSRPRGVSVDFVATGVYSDGSVVDLTDSVTWTTGSTSVTQLSATAPHAGRAVGLNIGTAAITASFGGSQAQTVLTITPAVLTSLQLSPGSVSLAQGLSQSLQLTGIFSDLTSQNLTESAVWSSSTPASVTVSNAAGSRGRLNAIAAGNSTVIADVSGLTASAPITVSAAVMNGLTLSSSASTVARGLLQPIIATATLSDGSTMDVTNAAVWSVDVASIASINNAAGLKGQMLALDPGVVQITANIAGYSAQLPITVTAAELVSLQVTLANYARPLGLGTQLTATGIYTDGTNADLTSIAVWSSGTPTVAAVSNAAGARGAVSSLHTGSSLFTGTVGSSSGYASLTVTSAELVSVQVSGSSASLALGLSQNFSATGIYTDSSHADLTTLATWDSSVPAVASVSNAAGNRGLAQTLATGSTQIRATYLGISGQAAFAVSAAQLIGIAVSPASATLAKGRTISLVAQGTYTDGSVQDLTSSAVWTSSQTVSATVSTVGGTKGQVTAADLGAAAVSAAFGGRSGSSAIIVTSAEIVSLAVSPINASIAKGLVQNFTAMGTYSDGSVADVTSSVTWTSSNMARLSISNSTSTHGQGTALATGGVTVSASLGGVNDSVAFTVSAATLVSLHVSPDLPQVVLGLFVQFTATGTYTDGTTQNLTSLVTWTSSNLTVAVISNAAGNQGRANMLALGTATIRATLGAVTDTTTIQGLLF